MKGYRLYIFDYVSHNPECFWIPDRVTDKMELLLKEFREARTDKGFNQYLLSRGVTVIEASALIVQNL